MGHASMDKIPSSPRSPSPLPLPLVLLTHEFTNPHLINKHHKITATRALSRVDSFDSFQKDIYPPTPSLQEKLDKEPVFCNEKTEEKLEVEDDVSDYEQSDDTISFRFIGESVSRILGSGCEMINSKFDDMKSLVGERTVWSVGAATLFLGMVMYVRKRDRRERQLMMLLLEEKDQRIASMLQQIALINDIRSLNSRIPAIRR